MVEVKLKKRKLEKRIKYICCGLILLFACMMPLNVHAAEDSDIFSPASAKVYTAMSEDSDVAANLIVGSMFEVLGAESDAYGVVWYQVRTDFGVDGYVKANELDRVLQQVQEMQGQPQEPEANGNAEDAGNVENAEGSGDAENDNSEGNDEEGNDLEGGPGEEPIGELVVLESVNLRRMPSTGSEILGRINLNTTLPYYERYINDAGEAWYRIQYENMTGYVTEGAVTLTQQEPQSSEEEPNSSEEETKTSVQTEQPTQENIPSQEEVQFETELITADQGEFVVDEKPDVQKKHRRRKIDGVLIILVLGGMVCIAAFVIFVKKILNLLRK